MSPRRIRTSEELAEALASPSFLVFKHSTRCPISLQAFHEYKAFCEAQPLAPTAWIDVIEERELSRDVERVTGVRHESPQAILVHGGRALWNASHSALTRRTLAEALAGRPA